jgi:hypothetical protein
LEEDEGEDAEPAELERGEHGHGDGLGKYGKVLG